MAKTFWSFDFQLGVNNRRFALFDFKHYYWQLWQILLDSFIFQPRATIVVDLTKAKTIAMFIENKSYKIVIYDKQPIWVGLPKINSFVALSKP